MLSMSFSLAMRMAFNFKVGPCCHLEIVSKNYSLLCGYIMKCEKLEFNFVPCFCLIFFFFWILRAYLISWVYSTLESKCGCLYRDSPKFYFVRNDGLGKKCTLNWYLHCVGEVLWCYVIKLALLFAVHNLSNIAWYWHEAAD